MAIKIAHVAAATAKDVITSGLSKRARAGDRVHRKWGRKPDLGEHNDNCDTVSMLYFEREK